MDKLYELMASPIFTSLSMFASPEAIAFGIVGTTYVALAISWLRYVSDPAGLTVTYAVRVNRINPIIFLNSEGKSPGGSSASSRSPFSGIGAALRKVRANDAQKKVSSVEDSQSNALRTLQSPSKSQLPDQAESASFPFDGQRKRSVDQSFRLVTIEAEEAERWGYSRAFTAIEYREDVKKVWEDIGQLSDFVRYELLSALEQNPRIDALELAATILRRLEEERSQFAQDELNSAYRGAEQISKDAAVEFRRVIVLLGATVSPDKVLVKIRKKYLKHDHSSE